MNDNEHAMGNIPSFISASKVLIPEFLSVKKVQKQGANIKKIIPYPGVKEGIYLWQKYLNKENLNSEQTNKAIFIRPEPRTAQYYKGGENFLDEVIIGLKDQFQITLLTRDKEQFKHYNSSAFAGINVPEKPLSFDEISKNCLLFIGAGGTMTREMAVTGVPTISVYRDELLDVDRYLIEQNLMKHLPDLTAENVIEYIQENNASSPNKQLLIKGKEPYYLIKSLIEETGKNGKSRNNRSR
jgi:predicted glycosyltransferase